MNNADGKSYNVGEFGEFGIIYYNWLYLFGYRRPLLPLLSMVVDLVHINNVSVNSASPNATRFTFDGMPAVAARKLMNARMYKRRCRLIMRIPYHRSRIYKDTPLF